ncbi:MAG: NAD(P)-dependent oxidoreductase, partial [Candidatus Aenigmarchaeota archaeon]|nr:NAD(P)-dependent oxidoreductase [Candidatus Aenigmarchaeota archaeon]
MSQKIIITGGLGFIGSHLTRRLLNEGNTVTIIDKSNDSCDITDLVEQNKLIIINADLLTDNIDSYFNN